MKKYLFLMCALFALVSCNKQEVYETTITKTLVIYLNYQDITRSVPTTDPKPTENNINNVTIGVFKSDGTVKTIKEFTAPSKSITMKVANLATTDKVICITNSVSGTFADCKNIDDFNAKEISLDKALTTNTVDIVANNLIMYGSGGIVANGDGYVSNVDIYHLNSKVTLNTLSTSIQNNGTFKAKEIYLINVPSGFKYSYENPYLASGIYYHGALNAQISGQSQKLYLGSGNINSTVNKLFFYSSPNNSIKYTKIVIFGTYDPDGCGPLQGKDTYYPIIVDKNLLPNKNYVLNVNIKGIGIDDPTGDLNYSNLTVVLNINNFDDIIKDVSLD